MNKSNVHVDHKVLHNEISPKRHCGRRETKFTEQKQEHSSFQGYTPTAQHEYLNRAARDASHQTGEAQVNVHACFEWKRRKARVDVFEPATVDRNSNVRLQGGNVTTESTRMLMLNLSEV